VGGFVTGMVLDLGRAGGGFPSWLSSGIHLRNIGALARNARASSALCRLRAD
jgi:hypothetical protein